MVVATRQAFAERVGEFCNSENGKWYPDLDCVVCGAVPLKECLALQKCPYPLDVGATLDGWYSQQLALGLETATLCHIIVQRI